MSKKFVIVGICLLAICFFILPYIVYTHDKNNEREELSLNKSEVQQINISTLPSLFTAVDITSEDQIYKIVDYLTSLNTIKTNLNPGDYFGMSYIIKIHLKNGTDRELILSGNKFFTEPNRFIYEIPYNEATKFDIILGNILENNEDKDGVSSITGTIVSVNTELSGRDISCVIKDKSNTIHSVNVENAHIIDSTGNGWMILHEKDKQTNKDNVTASTVYIKTTAQ